jgi:leucyl/phenylalanyl-tRNA---protein transferase
MFSRVDSGSKIALFHLMQHLSGRGFQLFDVQYVNPHTKTLGAVEISRDEYLAQLQLALRNEVTF